MRINSVSVISYKENYKKHQERERKVEFQAIPACKKNLSKMSIGVLITAFLTKIGLSQILKLNSNVQVNNNGEIEMSELNKFKNIRDDFSKKLAPASRDSELYGWEFYIKSTPKTQQRYEKAEDDLYSLYKNEEIYNKLLNIDKSKLPKHEAKQLRDLLRTFDEELNTGEIKKSLRKKETDISQKFNTYIPYINGKESSKANINAILETELNPEIRKTAYEARIKSGDLIAEDLIELVKMRNEYAKTKGYDNYFDYMIKEEYNVEPEILDKLINDVYSQTKTKIRTIQEKKKNELEQIFGTDNLKAYHYGLLSEDNPENKVNKILSKNNIEKISKSIYSGMGYNISRLQRVGKITLDLYPRKEKNTHGFCFGIEAGKDSRILANLGQDTYSLDTLNHELGHCIYYLGISKKLPFLDQQPSSSALTEAIAMMMGDIIKKEDVLSDILPTELLDKFKESLKEDDAIFISKSLQIIDFERELYRNPDQNPAKLWADMKKKYLNRDEEPDNEWAVIPHYLTHPGYYQNYFRATLMKAQIYNHLHAKLGNITENKSTAKYMNKNIFSLGASIDEYDLIKQLTGKELSVDDFVKEL